MSREKDTQSCLAIYTNVIDFAPFQGQGYVTPFCLYFHSVIPECLIKLGIVQKLLLFYFC